MLTMKFFTKKRPPEKRVVEVEEKEIKIKKFHCNDMSQRIKTAPLLMHGELGAVDCCCGGGPEIIVVALLPGKVAFRLWRPV